MDILPGSCSPGKYNAAEDLPLVKAAGISPAFFKRSVANKHKGVGK